MARIITKALLGVEDLILGTGTSTRANSTGGTINISQIPLSIAGGNPTLLGTSTLGSGSILNTCTSTSPTIADKLISYNGVPLVANGLSVIVAQTNLTAQQASISATTLYAVPASGAGMYRASAYIVITQAATSSSTLPSVAIGWTDADSSFASELQGITQAVTGNTVGLVGMDTSHYAGSIVINAKANTNIQYSTTSYASVGATPMLYAVRIRLEYLG